MQLVRQSDMSSVCSACSSWTTRPWIIDICLKVAQFLYLEELVTVSPFSQSKSHHIQSTVCFVFFFHLIVRDLLIFTNNLCVWVFFGFLVELLKFLCVEDVRLGDQIYWFEYKETLMWDYFPPLNFVKAAFTFREVNSRDAPMGFSCQIPIFLLSFVVRSANHNHDWLDWVFFFTKSYN